MTNEIRDIIRKEIEEFRIENKKLMETMNSTLSDHIKRVEPVIQKYEKSEEFNKTVTVIGDRVIYWSKVVGAVGVVALAVKFGLLEVLKYKP